MEIRIKTHDEARSGRVTIEIDGNRAEVESIKEPVYADLADLHGQLEQATERALMLDTALAQKQAECDRVTENYQSLTPVIEAQRGRIDELEVAAKMDRQTIDTLRRQVAEYDRDLNSQKKRAIEHAARAGKVETKLFKIRGLIDLAENENSHVGAQIRAVLDAGSTATE